MRACPEHEIRMKICVFNVTSTIAEIGSAEVGGLEAHAFRLADALIRRGHEVVLFGGAPHREFPLPPTAARVRRFPHVATARLPDFGTRFRKFMQRYLFARGCRKAFLEERFDAALLFKTYDFAAARLWRKSGWRGRLVARLSGAEFFAGDRRCATAVDAIYAVSGRLASEIGMRYGRVSPVIPNFAEASPPAAPSDPPVVLAAGRLVGWKGFDLLLRAFAKTGEARLWIAGDGPERGRLEKLARELGLAARVEFLGALLPSALAARRSGARVAAQPSVGYDSCPNASIEALGAGLTLVASDAVDLTSHVDRENVLLRFRAGDAEGLASELNRALREPMALWAARGARARALIGERFSEARLVSRVEALLGAFRSGDVEAETRRAGLALDGARR